MENLAVENFGHYVKTENAFGRNNFWTKCTVYVVRKPWIINNPWIVLLKAWHAKRGSMI